MICLADVIAPHAREAVDELQALGVKVVLLSGDHRTIAHRVAREVGIDTVLAEVLPDQKQAVVARLRGAGQVVAMVGDGINDAPALAAADVGIAIGSGSDIAIETADVVITGDDLRAVGRTLALGRATLRTIKQNLGWAFGYNLLLIPLAAESAGARGGYSTAAGGGSHGHGAQQRVGSEQQLVAQAPQVGLNLARQRAAAGRWPAWREKAPENSLVAKCKIELVIFARVRNMRFNQTSWFGQFGA